LVSHILQVHVKYVGFITGNNQLYTLHYSKISNLIYKFTTSVRASVCLTRQFCILIHRQNRPNIW
jgi:hypothetical protein